MAIPEFTKYPSRQSPTTFSDDGDTFLSEMAAFISGANALGVQVAADEVQTNADVVSCAASVVLADAAADIALSSSNYKGPWSSCSGSANIPYCVSHLGKFWQLSSNVIDVTAKTPGTDAEWLQIGNLPVVLTAKTSSGPLSATELVGNVVITNTGAGGEIELTLQAGAVNYSIEFEVTVAQYLKVAMAGAETCGYGATVGAAGGYVRSNVIGTRWKMTWNGVRWSISGLVGTLKYDK